MWMPERLKVWQVLFLLFPLLIWLAYSSYVDFTHLEEEGGVLYVGRTTKLLYDLGGKWAVVGFPIVIAGFWGYAVYKTLALSKKAEALAERAETPPPSPSQTAAAVSSRPPVAAPRPAAAMNPPPAASRPPAARAASSSGTITPLAAAPPPAPVRADDVPPDPSGPKFLR